MSDAVDSGVWNDFMRSAGIDAELSVKRSLEANQHLFDLEDGTHGKWVDEELGVLFVWKEHDLFAFLSAWHDANEGSWAAQKAIFAWMDSFVDFLDKCIMSEELWEFTSDEGDADSEEA